MISVELSCEGKAPEKLHVFLDREGLASLMAQLEFLARGKTDHVHLMSSEWGGSHLESRAGKTGTCTIHHVQVDLI